MKIFWIRFMIFTALWIFMIFRESEQTAISICFAAAALAFLFFLSIDKEMFYTSISLSITIFVHGLLVTDGSVFTVLLLIFVTIVSLFRLQEKRLLIYAAVNFLLTVTTAMLFGEFVFELIILSALFYFMVFVLNRQRLERIEQVEVYDQILGEYRKLKRMNLMAENNARLEERTKIARDIHDSVGHRLTALIMKLEMLSIEQRKPEYQDLKEMAQESLDEIRQAVQTLKTEELEGISTVVHLIRKLEAESHILVQFTMKQGVLSVKLSNEKSIVLYRVIQEALTNAMRHAQSREVRVVLGKSANGGVSFEVINQIFNVIPFEYGFGLTNMKARVEETQGTLQIYQTDNAFIVQGTIPGD
ncbi:sensor histidine kinase [Virgibacillus siamensis]|uniref:sensor histidine kinase n=1 Tax=Virgibacillus siamensis TaxID=480071 RepID=UPI000986E19B|nr:sensor histidine kinase [Virgibacillus siamensis]